MRGLKKSKRVCWASDVNLCQVRLFLSEEYPSQVGLGVGAQDHLQAKTSWPPPSTGPSSGSGSDDNLPPGFEGAHPVDLLKNKLSQIPLAKWRCPPRCVLDFAWQVVAGDESREVEVQNQREMRVLEAIFPRPSAIPSNPSELMNMEDSHHNDQLTPLIPITPIEDEESTADTSFADTSFDYVAPNTVTMVSPPPQLAAIPSTSQSSAGNYPNSPANQNAPAGMVCDGVESDVAAAALTAVTSNGQANLIDHDLLIKILSDPKLSQKLVTNPQIMPKSSSSGIILPDPPLVHVSRTEVRAPSSVSTPNLPCYPSPNMVRPSHSLLPPPPPVAKDINYYKSLIQQHGGEKPETIPQPGGRQNQQLVPNFEPVNNVRPRDLKPKIMKPCMYFNSSRGCRHGANCLYQHDVSAQQRGISMPEVQSAKRMKMEREISGLRCKVPRE